METNEHKLIIIGAGLTGLALAYLLKKINIDTLIIEARDRLGGRIYTTRTATGTQIEMGATWLGKKHTHINGLLNELELPIFEQILGDRAIYEAISTSPPQLVQLPKNEEPSYRIQNGTDTIIHKLTEEIGAKNIILGEQVVSLTEIENEIEIETKLRKTKASKVVSTLPPYLFMKTIQTSPPLPVDLQNIMNQTHTWMGESIKIGLTYETPFWRTPTLSGTIFSNVGPIPEMYDHSNNAESTYALKGFLNGVYFPLSRKERLELVLQQIRKYYGKKVDEYREYHEYIWRKDAFTFVPYTSHILPHQNNGNTIYQEPVMHGKLYIAGSETAQEHPGYMEGAIRSAHYIFNKLGYTE